MCGFTHHRSTAVFGSTKSKFNAASTFYFCKRYCIYVLFHFHLLPQPRLRNELLPYQ